MPESLRRNDLLYPELSYVNIGILYEVFNTLGYKYQEKYYQRAIKKSLQDLSLSFEEQVGIPLKFKGAITGRYIPDFIIENKIVLEIKRGDHFSQADIRQLLAYLEAKNLKLGILAIFSSNGLKFKRIINIR